MNKEKSLEREAKWKELMLASQLGDSDAYGKLLKEVASTLKLFLQNRVQESSDGEDIIQEVLLGIHAARHTYDTTRSFEAWMFSIARHKLIDFYRKHSRRNEVQLESLDWEKISNESLSSPSSTMVDTNELKAAVDHLSPEQQVAVKMLKFESRSVRDVARKLKMNEGAVRTMASRAYQKLRENLLKKK
ncbi:MAG: polymerase sigma factor, sigma-70 family [Bacteriovoracaceae bacterium]|nr:polymerase sigma factor, sigma-70 family [Bacteriovoracaceae bacterium]